VPEPRVQRRHREAVDHLLVWHAKAAVAARNDAERERERPEDGRAKVRVGALAVLGAALRLLGPLQARHARHGGEGVGLVVGERQLAGHAWPAQPLQPDERLVEAVGCHATHRVVGDGPLVKCAHGVLRVALVVLRALLLALGLRVVIGKRARLLVLAGDGPGLDAAVLAHERVAVNAKDEPVVAVRAHVGSAGHRGGGQAGVWAVRQEGQLVRLKELRLGPAVGRHARVERPGAR